jgi:hypothetical protein
MTVSGALPAAAEAWGPAARKLGVRARLVGAFSFGAPQIEYVDNLGARRACALADLMIVSDDLRTSHSSRHALLVRTVLAGARPVDHQDCQLRAPNPFEAWPAFRFRGGASSEFRDLSDADPATDPARVAIIDLRPGTAGWRYRRPSMSQLTDPGLSFGTLLAAIASGSAGRPAVRGGHDPWSLTVDELLRRTVRATLTGLAAPGAVLRSAMTFRGETATGHVLFENHTGLDCEEAVSVTGQDGPISVVHLCLD